MSSYFCCSAAGRIDLQHSETARSCRCGLIGCWCFIIILVPFEYLRRPLSESALVMKPPNSELLVGWEPDLFECVFLLF